MATHDRRFLSINLSKVCRHRGGSFPDQLAYIARTVATNPRTGAESNYQSEGPVETAGIIGWGGSRDELISSAVFSEKRQKAVEGRHLILALPHELNRADRRQSTESMADYLVKNYGVAVVFAVHPPSKAGDQRNWHAHLLFTSRRVEAGRSLGKKTREWDSLKTGGRHVEELRAWWCASLNAKLSENGRDANIEHRSYERLGIEGAPTTHKGERTAIERSRKKSINPAPVSLDPKLRTLPPLLKTSAEDEAVIVSDYPICRPGMPFPSAPKPSEAAIVAKPITPELPPAELAELADPLEVAVMEMKHRRKLRPMPTPSLGREQA